MNRNLKLLLASLLGFSAACSSVRSTPAQSAPTQEQTPDGVEADTVRHRIVVMYGVRPPQRRQPGVDPVAERPVDSLDVSLKRAPQSEHSDE
ncbi:hypothetical protein [uncultured Alistipes sp.]|uniref:hypothetical protein n=1 Tax=uncultured Alistipes sp. TaxID=538949 RepID=UPI0025CF4481|nr:hypothetical protein [uncultured Alistipes sp.]